MDSDSEWGNIDENDPDWEDSGEEKKEKQKDEQKQESKSECKEEVPSAEELAEEREVQEVAKRLEEEERKLVLAQIAEAERKERYEIEELVRKIEQEEAEEERKRSKSGIVKRLKLDDQKLSPPFHSRSQSDEWSNGRILDQLVSLQDPSVWKKDLTPSEFIQLHQLNEAQFINRLENPSSAWKDDLLWPEEYKNITREDITYLSKVLNFRSYGDIKSDGPLLLCMWLPMERWQKVFRKDCRKLLSYHDNRPFVLSQFDRSVFGSDSWSAFCRKYLVTRYEDSVENRSIKILQQQWMEYTTSWLLYEHNKFPLYRKRISPLSQSELNFIIADMKNFTLNIMNSIFYSAGLHKDVIGIIMEYVPFSICGSLWGTNESISWAVGNTDRSPHKTYLKWLITERKIIKDRLPGFRMINSSSDKEPYDDNGWITILFRERLFVDYPFISNEVGYTRK